MMRLAWLLLCITVAVAILHASGDTTPASMVEAKAAILIDRYTGWVLWEKNADQPLPMASTTKIMTAIVILDHGADKLNEPVTVSALAASTGGSSVFGKGDVVTLGDLLRAALLRSSNEATVAAAEYLGGSGGEAQFIQWMNDKARELNLQHTHYMNPHGLFDPHHYTCARDLAIIARYALSYPLLREIVSTKNTTVYVPQRQTHIVLDNHNKHLGHDVPGIEHAVIDGVKTGFVREAGKCLVTSATQNGWQLIAVVLNSPDMYAENERLLYYGFRRFAWHTYASRTLAGATAPVAWGAAVRQVQVGAKDVLGLPVLRPEYGAQPEDQVRYRPAYSEALIAPVHQGDEVGTLEIVRNGKVATSLPAVALQSVPVAWWVTTGRKAGYAAGVLLVLIIGMKVYGTLTKSARRRRRRLEEARRRAYSSGQGNSEW